MKRKLLSAAKKFGTPLYVYDGNRITDNYKQFEKAFSVDNLAIHYACKALTNLSILKLIKKIGGKLDTVSIGEIKLGLHAGFAPEDIVFTPNGVTFEEYAEAIELGVKFTVDNLTILEKIGVAFPDKEMSIRINPHLMAGGSKKISVGHIDSKFGISIHQLPIIKRIVSNLNINVTGVHVHTGSDILDPDIFIRAAQLIFDVADEFENIKSLDFGSGFKVAYKEGDHYTDIKKIGTAFNKTFNDYCKKRNRDIELRFEPGKYLVSDAGYFLVSTNVIKQTTACTFVAVNSGFNHLIRPMFYDAYHGIFNLSNPKGDKKLYSVVGHICETDTFAEDRFISEVREKDILAFKNAGAYCFSMASSYNSRPRPAEVLLLNDEMYLIRKRESFEDLLHNQVIPEGL